MIHEKSMNKHTNNCKLVKWRISLNQFPLLHMSYATDVQSLLESDNGSLDDESSEECMYALPAQEDSYVQLSDIGENTVVCSFSFFINLSSKLP